MPASAADMGRWRSPSPVAASNTGTGPAAKSPIIANWAAPETMTTEEKIASQGENPALKANTPYAVPKKATARIMRAESRMPWRNDGFSSNRAR